MDRCYRVAPIGRLACPLGLSGRRKPSSSGTRMTVKQNLPAAKSAMARRAVGAAILLVAALLTPPMASAQTPAQPAAPATTAAPASSPAATALPPMTATPAAAITLPRDLSPWGMFMAADIIVNAVMVGLAFASVLTWTIWLAKLLELTRASVRLRRGIAAIGAARTWDAARAHIGATGGVAPLLREAEAQLKLTVEA